MILQGLNELKYFPMIKANALIAKTLKTLKTLKTNTYDENKTHTNQRRKQPKYKMSTELISELMSEVAANAEKEKEKEKEESKSKESKDVFCIKYSNSLTQRQASLLKNLEVTKTWVENTLGPIIRTSSRVSIRMMDWFVTNYTKSHGISIQFVNENGVNRTFSIHDEYEEALDGLGRKLFDPFRRGSRVFIEIKNEKNMQIYETTVGQLSFWKWADTHGVLGYAHEHAEEIEKDMNQAHHRREVEKLNSNGKRKRSSLSKRADENCVLFGGKESGAVCRIDFDDDPDFY